MTTKEQLIEELRKNISDGHGGDITSIVPFGWAYEYQGNDLILFHLLTQTLVYASVWTDHGQLSVVETGRIEENWVYGPDGVEVFEV